MAGLAAEEIVRHAPRALVLSAIAEIQGVPYIGKIGVGMIDEKLLAQFDQSVMRRGAMVPVSKTAHAITLAVANPYNTTAFDYCTQQYECEIVMVMGDAAEIARIIEGQDQGPSREELAALEVVESVQQALSFSLVDKSEDTMTELIRSLFARAVSMEASDIHIKTEERVLYVTYRVNGDLGHRQELNNDLRARMDAFLLSQVRLNRDDAVREVALSGRLTLLRGSGRKIDVRYERHRSYPAGFHITLRLLDKTGLDPKLGQGSLTFDRDTLLAIRQVLEMPDGIIIMTGPTGSGKSTTLGAFLREVTKPIYNVMTLENPVEDMISGVVHCDMLDNGEFPKYFRSFMRSDPDIMYIGEVRDKASADLAIEAAITGHQVLTTTHANCAADVFNRFELIGVERWKIAATVRAVCAQRLIKRLCPICRARHEISSEEVELYGLPPELLGRDVFEANPAGCHECKSGYKGRFPILEILPISRETARFIANPSNSAMDIENKVRNERPNLKSIKTFGIEAILSGTADVQSVKDHINLLY